MSSLLKQGALAAGLVGTAVLFAAPVFEQKCTTTGGIGCASDDGQFSTEFGGRIQVDGNFFDDDNDITNNNDGVEFRRLRFFNKFELYGKYFGKIQIDFAGDSAEIQDAYIGVKDVLSGDLVVGQEKIPFSLEELTSSKYITFIERSAITEVITGRNIGIGHSLGGEDWTLWNRVYSTDGADEGAGDTASDGIGVGSRLTFTPKLQNGAFIHLGAALNYEGNIDAGNFVGAFDGSVEPEAHLANDVDVFSFQSTGAGGTTVDPTDSVDIFRAGVEAAFQTGPLSLQGEYQFNSYDDDAGFDQEVQGGYVAASYFLTPGDSRGYKEGTFARVKPKSKQGAWEVAARYSVLSNDDAQVLLPNGDTKDTELNALTLALNWYPNSHTRVMFNYVRPEITGVDEERGIGLNDDNPNIFLLRFQADYGD